MNGRIWDVVLIVEGWSKNGRYYPAEVLRQAIPLFESSPIAVYGYQPGSREHVPSEVHDEAPGLIMNVAGWASNVREDNENRKLRIVATFKCANDQVRELLQNAHELGEMPFGLSIDALAECREGVAEGRSGLIVTRIHHVNETTIVDRPAAGGRFLRLVASLGKPKNGEKEMTKSSDFLKWLVDDKKERKTESAELGGGVTPPPPTVGAEDSLTMMLELALEFQKAGNVSAAQMVLSRIPNSNASVIEADDEEQVDGETLDKAVLRLRTLSDEIDVILSEGHIELEPLRPGFDEMLTALEEAEAELGATPTKPQPTKPSGIAEARRRPRR